MTPYPLKGGAKSVLNPSNPLPPERGRRECIIYIEINDPLSKRDINIISPLQGAGGQRNLILEIRGNLSDHRQQLCHHPVGMIHLHVIQACR